MFSPDELIKVISSIVHQFMLISVCYASTFPQNVNNAPINVAKVTYYVRFWMFSQVIIVIIRQVECFAINFYLFECLQSSL